MKNILSAHRVNEDRQQMKIDAVSFIFDSFLNTPFDSTARALVGQTLASTIPQFHLQMMNDRRRNRFYETILRENIRGKTVLEIGTGAGLLALLCVRLGAKHVFTCETNPILHRISREIFRKHGVEKKITSFNLHSRQLEVGNQIPSKVDCLVSELFGDTGFSENVIDSVRDAKRLLKKGGLVLPEKLTLLVQACELPAAHSLARLDPKLKKKDFDFSIFEEVLRSRNLGYPKRKLRLLGKPQNAIEIDFNALSPSDGIKGEVRLELPKASKSGYVCLGFQISSGSHKLGTLGLPASQTASHWMMNVVHWNLPVATRTPEFIVRLESRCMVVVLPKIQ